MIWLYILVFIVSCFVLMKAGGLTVKSLTRIAQLLQWSEFLVAFVLVAFVTTFPELFVGITSALYRKPQLAFGNIIGSNVVHLTFVAALGVFLCKKIKTGSVIIQRTSFYTALIAALPIILMLDKTISRVDGVVLLFALVLYFTRLFYQKERFSKVLAGGIRNNGFGFKILFRNLGLFLVGVVLLLLAAQGIVWASVNFAASLGWSLALFGILLLGLGTNLPEITFAVKAAKMGHKDMILGDLMGAVAINSGFVLGVSSLIHPISIFQFSPYLVGIIFTIAAVLLFALFTRSEKQIDRKEGLVLLFAYILFVVVQLLIK